MNWAAAIGSGFGLGILYFSGLRHAVRANQIRPASRVVRATGLVSRLALAGIVLFALLKSGGSAALLFGLAGVLLARGAIIQDMGKTIDGR